MTTSVALTVAVMSYDEAASFEATCHELLTVLALTGVRSELLVIDDGSRDGTERLADALAARDGRVRVVHHATNQGLGGVYRTGFREARGELLTFFPADGQFPATIVAQFLPLLATHDMVLGYLPRRDGSLVGRWLSLVERILYRALFGRFPRFQGIVMFRRVLLDRYALRSSGRGWAVLMEFILCCVRDRVAMTSVPTEMRPRAHGASKVNNLRTIWSNFRQLVQLRGLPT